MRRPIKSILTLLALALPLVAATQASAKPIDVIRDCSRDGKLDRKYSQKELKGALRSLPSDLDEYTDCRAVIRAAQLAGAGRKGGGSGLLGLVDPNAPPTPSEQQELDRAHGGPVSVGGRPIKPGIGAAFGTDLPPWVLAALTLLGAATLAGSTFAFQRRWPERWQAASTTLGGPARRVTEGVKRGIARFRR